MRRVYVIGHWFFTLLIAPFSSQAIESIYGGNAHQVVGLLEVYPITVLFSIVFSIPTFFIYIVFFYSLSKQNVSFAVSKFMLIVISVLGIFITQTIIEGSMSRDIIITYSVTSIFVGLVLRLKKTETKKHEKYIPT